MPRKGRVQNLTPWKPGQSGNPGGRPKGFAARIKELTDDYARIAEGFALIAFGTPSQRKQFFGAAVRVSTRDRLNAIVELRDSGPGRPRQTFELDGKQAVPLFALPAGTRPDIGGADSGS